MDLRGIYNYIDNYRRRNKIVTTASILVMYTSAINTNLQNDIMTKKYKYN